MTEKELLVEIEFVKVLIALEPFGSGKIEALTLRLIIAYDQYVNVTSHKNERRKAA